MEVRIDFSNIVVLERFCEIWEGYMKEVINENNCKKDKEILIYDKVGLIDNEVEYFDS